MTLPPCTHSPAERFVAYTLYDYNDVSTVILLRLGILFSDFTTAVYEYIHNSLKDKQLADVQMQCCGAIAAGYRA